MPFKQALEAGTTHLQDFVLPYVNDLRQVIDMDAIRAAGLQLAVDPLGGAAVHYWGPINEIYGLNIEMVNPRVDPTFSFMTVDGDGKIRMDCSSPYATARLVGLRNRYRVAFANDPDSDRHGIVTPAAGLMNPNHFLAVAIHYLLTHRPHWPTTAVVGKTVASSSLIDRVVRGLGRGAGCTVTSLPGRRPGNSRRLPVGLPWCPSAGGVALLASVHESEDACLNYRGQPWPSCDNTTQGRYRRNAQDRRKTTRLLLQVTNRQRDCVAWLHVANVAIVGSSPITRSFPRPRLARRGSGEPSHPPASEIFIQNVLGRMPKGWKG